MGTELTNFHKTNISDSRKPPLDNARGGGKIFDFDGGDFSLKNYIRER